MRKLITSLLLAVILVACTGQDPSPQVSQARIVLPPPGMQMAAGYFELENPGPQTLHIRSVSSDGFRMAEIHQTIVEEGLSKMREVKNVEIPGGTTRSFEPGGWHIMLMGYVGDPSASATIPVKIEMQPEGESARDVIIEFQVERAGAPG